MQHRAVVIDGDAGRLEQTTKAFQAAGIAATGIADGGGDVVARVREVAPVLVVISDDLPNHGGRAALAALRKDKGTRDATYMILTAGAPREVAAEYAEHDARAHDFAPRSISAEDLVNRSKRLLASQGVTTGGMASFSIGVTGNPQGPAKAAVVASSEPSAGAGDASGLKGGGKAAAPVSAHDRKPVAISYSTGKSSEAKPGLEDGKMTINPSFGFSAEAPAKASAPAAPASTGDRTTATTATGAPAPSGKTPADRIQALLARAAGATDIKQTVAALEEILMIAHDEMEDLTTAVMTAEKIVEFDPGHVTAVSFLREVYQQLGAKEKLAAVEAGFRRAVLGK